MHIFTLLALMLSLALPAPLSADQLGQPQGPVILTIGGALSETNAADTAAFDLAMLEALPGRETRIETPWYDGAMTFSGPLLSELLAAVGATGNTIKVTALNEYSAELPFSDAIDYPVILAVRINGETIPVRSKGPGFIIYPFDADPSLYNEMIFGRSVWQVARIEVY